MLQQKGTRKWLRIVFASASVSMAMFATGVARAHPHHGGGGGGGGKTPIDHLIVIVGENHTYDNVFGGYVPTGGQTVWNLLSE